MDCLIGDTQLHKNLDPDNLDKTKTSAGRWGGGILEVNELNLRWNRCFQTCSRRTAVGS